MKYYSITFVPIFAIIVIICHDCKAINIVYQAKLKPMETLAFELKGIISLLHLPSV